MVICMSAFFPFALVLNLSRVNILQVKMPQDASSRGDRDIRGLSGILSGHAICLSNF